MTDETKPERDYSLFGDDHIRTYRETNGEVGHIWNGVPCLILTTRRKVRARLAREGVVVPPIREVIARRRSR